jgi:hypothetical protein
MVGVSILIVALHSFAQRRANGAENVGRSGAWRADRKLVPVPEQQTVIRHIRRLTRAGHSPRVISRRLREDGVMLSHVTVRKIIRRAA